MRKFLRFRHAAIRRFGDKKWTVSDGFIEFSTTYTVSVSLCEKGIIGGANDYPYIIELSNGTKFLSFIHDYGMNPNEDILSPKGVEANGLASEYCYSEVQENIELLNRY